MSFYKDNDVARIVHLVKEHPDYAEMIVYDNIRYREEIATIGDTLHTLRGFGCNAMSAIHDFRELISEVREQLKEVDRAPKRLFHRKRMRRLY